MGEKITSGTVRRVVPGHLIYVDVSNGPIPEPSQIEQRSQRVMTIGLKPDHILIDSEGTIESYGGQPFEELELRQGGTIKVQEKISSDGTSDYFIVTERKRSHQLGLQSTFMLLGFIVIILAMLQWLGLGAR